MEFEKYNPEEHDSALMQEQTRFSEIPEDVEKFQKPIEEALDDARDVFGITVDFDVVVAKTDLEEAEKRDGYSPHTFINGMGLTTDFKNVKRNMIFVRVCDEIEDWRSFLKSLIVHEEAHLEFQKKRKIGYSIAEHLLSEGYAMHSDRKVSEKKNYSYRQDWELPEIDPEELKEELDKKRAWNEGQSDESSTLFDYGGDKWPYGEGYPLAFHLTKEIMERKNWDVQDLVNVSEEEWKKEVEKSIDNLYN